MRYIDFERALRDSPIFSLGDIRTVDPRFHRRRLNEWQAKAYIQKICRGYYIFTQTAVTEEILFEISNKIYSPSYISCESALACYGLIPENVYAITAVTPRRTYAMKTPVGRFIYRTINSQLFFGYEIRHVAGRPYKTASPEKAILDFFYLNPQIKDAGGLESLRLNTDHLRKIIRVHQLRLFAKRFEIRRVRDMAVRLVEGLAHA